TLPSDPGCDRRRWHSPATALASGPCDVAADRNAGPVARLSLLPPHPVLPPSPRVAPAAIPLAPAWTTPPKRKPYAGCHAGPPLPVPQRKNAAAVLDPGKLPSRSSSTDHLRWPEDDETRSRPAGAIKHKCPECWRSHRKSAPGSNRSPPASDR